MVIIFLGNFNQRQRRSFKHLYQNSVNGLKEIGLRECVSMAVREWTLDWVRNPEAINGEHLTTKILTEE